MTIGSILLSLLYLYISWKVDGSKNTRGLDESGAQQ